MKHTISTILQGVINMTQFNLNLNGDK